MKQILYSLIYFLRDFLIIDFKQFLINFFSILKGILRLGLLTIKFIVSGLNEVVFSSREVCDFNFIYDILSKDADKLAYIDKLNLNMIDNNTEYDECIIIEEDEEDY